MFNDVKAFVALIKSSLLWRVYFVFAMKRSWTKLLVAVALVLIFPVVMFGVSLLNWPLPSISNMDKTEGTLVSVYNPLKPNRKASIRVSTISGEDLKYRGASFDKAQTDTLRKNIGRAVLVRSNWFYDIAPPFYYRKYFRIEIDGRIIFDLGGSNYFNDSYYESERRIFWGFIIVIAISLFLVFFACFRDARIK